MARKHPDPKTEQEVENISGPAIKKPRAKQPSQKGKPQRRPITRAAQPIPPAPVEEVPPTEQQIKEALDNGMVPFEIQLVETYLTCFNGGKSYQTLRPHVSIQSAQAEAATVLGRPRVREYLSKRMSAMFKRTEESQDRLLNQYQAIVYGDAAEFSEYRRECCRYCWGNNHRYQYTAGEMEKAKERHEEAQEQKLLSFMMAGGKESEFKSKPFDEKGGIGFKRTREPNADCPECFGEGIGREVLKDTRTLSPAAQILFDGVEVTKDGIKIKHQDRSKARSELAKILKLFEDNTKVEVNFTPEAMESMFGQKMSAARQRTRTMLEGRKDELDKAQDEAG